MAKIFSNISKAQGLTRIYTSSSINDIASPFFTIRNVASPSGPTSIGLVTNQIRRIEPIYDMFSTKNKASTEFNANKLRIVPPARKLNRVVDSTIYDRFSTNNPYLISETQILPENNTLVEIKPYSKDATDTSTMQQESRTLPLISGPRDEKRFLSYMKSSEGISFLARQQILQAGNTFKQSRRYNPASVTLAISKYATVSVANPLERVDRTLSLNSQSTSQTIPQMIEISDMAGRLQQESVLTKQQQLSIRFVGGQQNGSNRQTLLGQVVGTAVSRTVQNILNRTNVSLFGRRINLGQLGRQITTIAQTVNAIQRATNINDSTLKKDQTAYDGLMQSDLWPLVKDNTGTIQNFHIRKKNYVERAQKSLEVIKLRGKLHNNFFTKPYPDIEEDYRSSESYTDDVQTEVGEINGIVSARYMKDPMNYTTDGKSLFGIDQLDGKHSAEDFIKFKIDVPGVFDQGGISFRAFVDDLKHDGSGEFEEQRYVGRPERFIVYKGMSRKLRFVLYLIAFTKEELNAVWLKANMLNKLIYPINTNAGYMVPPIVILTIGNIIENQPGYVTSISSDFDTFPWDIDAEVTQAIKITMDFSIIEKNMITQAQTANSSTFADPFANKLISDKINQSIRTQTNIPNIDMPQVDLTPRDNFARPSSPEFTAASLLGSIEQFGEETSRRNAEQRVNDNIAKLINRGNTSGRF